MTAYADSIEALHTLINAGGRITMAPDEITVRSNGLEYYCLEVTKEPGHSQYAIRAYGEEARELFKEARQCGKIVLLPIVRSSYTA
jgi:hypothetical protein